MVAPKDKKDSKLTKSEHFDSSHGFTATITGGDPFARRYENDYSKVRHREQDKAAAEAAALGPDISLPKILLGVRQS